MKLIKRVETVYSATQYKIFKLKNKQPKPYIVHCFNPNFAPRWGILADFEGNRIEFYSVASALNYIKFIDNEA